LGALRRQLQVDDGAPGIAADFEMQCEFPDNRIRPTPVTLFQSLSRAQV
jgi:hypothetical protein